MNGTIDRRQMKLDAKAAMREHRPSVYGVAFVYLLILLVLEALTTRMQMPNVTMEDINALYSGNQAAFRQFFIETAQSRSGVGSLLSLAIRIMTGFLTGGFLLFCLNVARRETAGMGTLFDLFGYFFRFLWLEILMGIFIFLWSLLLVIPGIIAAYRYSMAMYLFFDDPEKGALECIRESKAMTYGYKGKLFVLDLSFIGWAILSIIPLVSIYTTPYMSTTKANYYRALRGEFYAQQQQQQNPWGTDGSGYGGGSWQQ